MTKKVKSEILYIIRRINYIFKYIQIENIFDRIKAYSLVFYGDLKRLLAKMRLKM